MGFKGTRPFAAPLGKGGGWSPIRLKGRNSAKIGQTLEQAELVEARAAAKRKRKAEKRLAASAYRAASEVIEVIEEVSSPIQETSALEFQPDE